MSIFNCRYQKDSNGNLVHYNANPEYVDRVFSLKEEILNLDGVYDELNKLVGEIEYRVFKDGGALFKTWLQENRKHLEGEIGIVTMCLLEFRDTVMERCIKERIVVMLKDFVK